eukprot:450085_1
MRQLTLDVIEEILTTYHNNEANTNHQFQSGLRCICGGILSRTSSSNLNDCSICEQTECKDIIYHCSSNLDFDFNICDSCHSQTEYNSTQRMILSKHKRQMQTQMNIELSYKQQLNEIGLELTTNGRQYSMQLSIRRYRLSQSQTKNSSSL